MYERIIALPFCFQFFKNLILVLTVPCRRNWRVKRKSAREKKSHCDFLASGVSHLTLLHPAAAAGAAVNDGSSNTGSCDMAEELQEWF